MNKRNKRNLLCAGFATALSLSAFANAYDDAKFVMDVRGDLNNDGAITWEEVGNSVKYRANAKSVSYFSPIFSPSAKEDPSIKKTLATEVANPYWCEDTRPQNYVYLPQTSWWDASTSKLMCDSAALKFAGEASMSETVTVYSRFRWDGPVSTNVSGAASWDDYQVIARNGEYWKVCGWTLGVTSGNAEKPATSGWMTVGLWDKKADSKIYVTKGVWYDVFAVIRRTGDASSQVKFTVIAPRTKKADGTYGRPSPSTATCNVSAPLVVNPSYTDLFVGSWSADTKGAVVVDRNGETSGRLFRGGIARVSIWERELSAVEMREVAGGAHGAMWSLGMTNGSANEFGADDYSATTSTKAAPIKETFRPADDPIRVMRGKLTSEHPTLTLRGFLDAREVGIAKALVINPILTDVGAECPVKVSLNDVEAGTIDLKSDTALVIKKDLWQCDADGEVELKITRTGAVAGALEIDSLLVGGAFQVGTDNSQAKDMADEEHAPEQFFVGDTNVVCHARRAAIATQNPSAATYPQTNLFYYVDVPARLADNCDFNYRTKIIVESKWKNYLVAFQVNGQTLWQTPDAGIVSYGYVDIPIPKGTFKGGMNELRWVMQTPCTAETMYWVNYDFHRLEIKKDWLTAPGLLLLLR